MGHCSVYCHLILFSFLICNSTCIKKNRFGLEYTRKTLPEKPENNNNAIIPETWKRFDSFKFDRSIQKGKDHVKGTDKNNFENRDINGNAG